MHGVTWQASLEQIASIRALSSLTRRDAASVRALVHLTGNHYRVEEHDDYDGYLSLLLTHERLAQRSFLVSGRVGAVDVAAIEGDAMVGLGRFPSTGAAMLALRPALEAEAIGTIEATARRPIDRHGSDADLHAAMRADAEGDDRGCAVIRAIGGQEDR